MFHSLGLLGGERKMMKTDNAGNMKKVTMLTKLDLAGNWNYTEPNSKKVFSKPMGNVLIDSDRFCFKHEELLMLLELYYEADEMSMLMIKCKHIDTGNVKNCETSFLDKIQAWINTKRMQK